MRRITFSTVPALAVLLLAATLTGCTGAGSSSDTAPADGTVEYGNSGAQPEKADPSFDSGAASGAGDSAAAPGIVSDASASATDRQVITTGYATITAKDPIAASLDAVRIVERAGGRVDSRTEEAPVNGNAGRASLTLRIPSAALTATLEELKGLGEVVSINTSDQDVTTQTQDLDARIKALSTSVDRLLALLATATDTSVLIELETAISSRQGELDSLQSQRRYLADQVSMSALTLELVSEVDAPAQNPDTFWDALLAGIAGFGAFFTGLFLIFGYLVPWIVLVGIGVLVALLILRRRRAKASASAAAATPAAPQPAFASPDPTALDGTVDRADDSELDR